VGCEGVGMQRARAGEQGRLGHEWWGFAVREQVEVGDGQD